MDIQLLTQELAAESTEKLFERLAFSQCLSVRLAREIYGELSREKLIEELLENERTEG